MKYIREGKKNLRKNEYSCYRRCRARRRAKVQRQPTRTTPYMEIRLTDKLLLMTKDDNLRLILE